MHRTELGEPDASGRRRPLPIAGSEFTIDCDAVIPAIGQQPEVAWALDSGLDISRRETFQVHAHTMQTSMPHIFAGGMQ